MFDRNFEQREIRERKGKRESYVTVRARVRFVWEFLAVRCGSLRSVRGEGGGGQDGRKSMETERTQLA